MKKLAAMAGAAGFVAVIGLSHGADAAGSRERTSSVAARPTGTDVLSSDSREAAIVARPSGMVAQAFSLGDDDGILSLRAEAKAKAQVERRIQYQVLTSDDEPIAGLVGSRADALARRFEGMSGATRHIKIQALTSDTPSGTITTVTPRNEGLLSKNPPAGE